MFCRPADACSVSVFQLSSLSSVDIKTDILSHRRGVLYVAGADPTVSQRRAGPPLLDSTPPDWTPLDSTPLDSAELRCTPMDSDRLSSPGHPPPRAGVLWVRGVERVR